MPFQIIRNDITKVTADAIVNTANPMPCYAAGTDQAVYMAAGAEDLLRERKMIGDLQRGEAAATPAFRLNAKYIIHTVGPVWIDGKSGEFETLASCYRKSLVLARMLGCGSIAFPLISTGVYGFPKDEALHIALREINAFLTASDSDMQVTLVVFDRNAFEVSSSLVESVGQYIDENYVKKQSEEEYGYSADEYGYAADKYGHLSAARSDSARESRLFREKLKNRRRREEGIAGLPMGRPMESPGDIPCNAVSHAPKAAERDVLYEESDYPDAAYPESIGEAVQNLGDNFQTSLFRLIDARNLKDSEVYHKANIDRKLFSKIRTNPKYIPKKNTILALAIALELNLDQTVDLLGSAGYALSPASKSDIIVRYCIECRIYDIYEVNALLFDFEEPCLVSYT